MDMKYDNSMDKHIYFVRHGKSESNADGICRGPNIKLVDHGREEARAVGERIKRIGVDALITSTFPRAIETGEIIGESINLPIVHEASLVEWEYPTVIHGRHRDEPEVKDILGVWFSEPANPHKRHSDEPTFSDLMLRAKQASSFLESYEAKKMCVVTHCSFLKVLIGQMVFGDLFTKELFIRMHNGAHISNTGITYVHLSEDGVWKLISWNDYAHLG